MKANQPSSSSTEPASPPRIHPPDVNGEEPAGNPATQAFRTLSRDLGEMKEYLGYYIAARKDSFVQSLKNAVLYAGLGVIGAIVGSAILITAAVLLVVGIAQGLGLLFGGRMWLGDLVTGVLILGGVGVTIWLLIKKITNNWRSQLVKKYEQRKREQRERFAGNDIDSRASQQQQAKSNGQRR